MIQEWILPEDRIFLLVAIIFGLADVFYLVLHKFLHRNRSLIVFCWGIYAVLIVFIAKNNPEPKPATVPALAPVTVEVPQPDYIDGTKFTHNELKEDFPFGYIVFRLKDAKWTYEPEVDGHIKDSADWSKVSITPDFINKTATWIIPNAGLDDPEGHNLYVGNQGKVTIPMDIGKCWPATIILESDQTQIMAMVGTLSANQLHPVFVLGFRIPTRSELQKWRTQ